MRQRAVLRRRQPRPYVAGLGVVVGVGLLILAMATGAAAAPANQSVAEGQRIFQQTCSACHTIGAGVRVGPDLQGVTERRDVAWLRVQIKSPSVHQAANDPVSIANRATYGLSMPDLGLTDQQVESVLASLQATAPTTEAMPSLYVPTLAASVLALAALTVVALRAGTKRVEVRP